MLNEQKIETLNKLDKKAARLRAALGRHIYAVDRELPKYKALEAALLGVYLKRAEIY